MKFVYLFALLVAICGCKKGYDPALMSKLNAGEHKLIGKYKLETEFGGEGGQQVKELMEAMASLDGGETTVEFLPDKTFAMMVSEVKVSGDWTLEATQLNLRLKQVGDKKPSEINRIELGSLFKSGFAMSGTERDQFLKDYGLSMALQRAESLMRLRVGADGTLYADSGVPTIFGSLTSYFKKTPQ